MHIFVTRYLEEGAPYFTKVTRDKKMIEDGGEVEAVSDLEEENTKKRALHKEKKDARALSLAPVHLSVFAFAVSVSGSAFPSTSASASAISMPGLSALLLSALPSASGVFVPVPGSSALLSFALPYPSSMSVPVPRSLAFPSVSSLSGIFVLIPGLSASPSLSGVPVPMPGSSLPTFPTWSFPQTPMPVLGRQKLGQ